MNNPPGWTPHGASKADFDPVALAEWYLEHAGTGAILQRQQLRAYGAGAVSPGFVAMKYRRPRGPLRHDVELPGCEGKTATIPTAAGNASFSSGQQVSVGVTMQGMVILGRPPGGLVGAGAFSTERSTGLSRRLVIQSVDPVTVEPDLNDQLITVTGRGFSQSPLDELAAAVYDADETSDTFDQYLADPYVTLHGLVWISPTQVTVLADTTADTPIGYRIGILGDPAA